jgi:hypothetical protein
MSPLALIYARRDYQKSYGELITMNLSFNAITNTPYEIEMGHKIWFEPIPKCNVISVTANAPGFTPLIAIARHYGWNYDLIARASAACNDSREVVIVQSVMPTLILVPATKGRGKTDDIIFDYLGALHTIKPKCLHFTHYGFLQGRIPAKEIAIVLDSLLGGYIPRSINSLIFDVDIRRSREFYCLMRPTLQEAESDDPWI